MTGKEVVHFIQKLEAEGLSIEITKSRCKVY